jgi:hypothetical protein
MSRMAAVFFASLAGLPLARGGLPTGGEDQREREELPIPIPERPFLLLDAPRRFTPSQAAWVRLQLRGGGRVRLHVYRVRDPGPIVERGEAWSQGLSVACSPLGREAELLSTSRRRRGALLTLVRRRTARVDHVRAPRRVKDETTVYDSYEEEEEVATYWVRRERWGRARARLGRLPAGLYLVRAMRGSWAAATYLSVGRLTLLARRGDSHDTVLVTDEDGAPTARVPVEAWAQGPEKGRKIHVAVTGADGTARLPASDTPSVRFIARRGTDIAWTDVTHARLARCDPRVYLATGRPVYRSGETIYLRGHLRGCVDGKGFAPLGNEPVRLSPGRDGEVTVRTDADGNFTAELVARGEISAEVRGRVHHRDVQIDHRSLPRRRLHVTLDSAWAESGRLVRVTVADDDGGWPARREVILQTPAGRQRGRIGPGRPARFRFRVPYGLPALKTARVSATITTPGRVTTATAELWIGARRQVLHLHADRTWSRPGATVPVRLTASNLGGDPVRSGTAWLSLRESPDGNRPVGPALWSRQIRLGPRGATGLVPVPIKGHGPWWIEARGGGATSSLVVWDRSRPPSLSARGPLAVRPRTLLASAGARLPVDVRLPRGGRAWLTLEQGSVWSTAMVNGGGRSRALLRVPAGARGMASVVVSHIARGRVKTVTATVEVETSRRVSLSVTTNGRVLAEGSKARVTVQARGPSGRPRDGVVSLWLADAGYWELGEDRYPLPGAFFKLPGRMASAGESSRPAVYGAEEGRHLDAGMAWNGEKVPGTTFRHGWGHGGELVTVRASGTFPRVADRLARAAGLAGAWVCPAAAKKAGGVSLETRLIPWDLVAAKVAARTETIARRRGRVLRFECVGLGGLGSLGAGGGGLSGRGAGAAGLLAGAIREQTLEGTLRFIGLRRLGPDGRLDLTLELPRHPGRWRVEALAISDDGGGERAHAIVHTARPLTASIELSSWLRPGDVTRGEIHLRGSGHPHRVVSLEARLPAAVELLAPLPSRVKLDGDGRATVPVQLRARVNHEGNTRPGSMVVAARLSGPKPGRARDAVRRRLHVLQPALTRPAALQSIVGPAATEVRLDVPALARRSRLRVFIEADLRVAVGEVLERLRRPRWGLSVLTIDRLASLRALEAAVNRLRKRGASWRRWPAGASPLGGAFDRHVRQQLDVLGLRAEIRRDIESVVAGLEDRQTPDGAIAWWSTLRSDTRLTAELLLLLEPRTRRNRPWRSALDVVRSRAKKGRVSPWAIGPVMALLATGDESDRRLARRLLHDRRHRVGLDTLEGGTWALRAARALREAALRGRYASKVARLVGARVAEEPEGGCSGVCWWLCLARRGSEAEVARAASALLRAKHPGARALAARTAAWLARRPTSPWWSWGTEDADVLALLAQLADDQKDRRAATRFEVLRGGRLVARGDIGVPATVGVARAGSLRVRFPAAAGRAVRLRVEGLLAVKAPKKDVGPARLNRRFTSTPAGRTLEVSFHLPRHARRLAVSVPLPAGLALAGDPSRAAETTNYYAWQSLTDVGEPRTRTGPRLLLDRGQLRLQWRRLRAGHHRVSVRLVATAPGAYQAGSAWLRAENRGIWALTRPTRVVVAP